MSTSPGRWAGCLHGSEREEEGFKADMMKEDKGSGEGVEVIHLVLTAKQPFGIATIHHGLTRCREERSGTTEWFFVFCFVCNC